MKFIPLHLAAPLFASFTHLRADEFVLVGMNTPPAPIVVYKGAPPRTRESADALVDCIEKIIRPGNPRSPRRTIWI